ncbi:MAG: UDP-N-acetylmuramoyl-L-alanine--D-glutamate ligase [Gammaproteobacteria bacterium]
MNDLKNQDILILGLGISGLAMARWCTRQGARVVVADTREQPPHLDTLRQECPHATFLCGPFDESLLGRHSWHLIARSPGLPPQQLDQVRRHAQSTGGQLVSELDLFARALADLSAREPLPYRPKVLAITGTNGKTTVTSLTGLLMERCGWRTAVAGNIGPTLLDVLTQALDHEACASVEDERQEASEASDGHLADDAPPPPPIQPPHLPQVWVLELSSFQLDGTAGGDWDAVPTAATVLNLSEDHLDWHGSMDAYVQAKQAIFGRDALMLLNRDDSQVMAMEPGLVTVKISGRNRQAPARPWTSFGLDAPRRPGEWGVESVNGMDWLVRAVALDETRKQGRSADEEEEVWLQRLMPADALRIRGRHNAANALAALALATSTGASLAPMLHGLREYRGEPHRVEPVGIIDEVEYFDDSKGTNVGATLAAVEGLGAGRRLVVILGGDGKGQDFAPLAQPLSRHARAVVLIGRDAAVIRAQVEQPGLPVVDATTMADAVRLCASHARSGDAVLLSPACASLDMYDDYVHRARVFVQAVAELAAERGQDLGGTI